MPGTAAVLLSVLGTTSVLAPGTAGTLPVLVSVPVCTMSVVPVLGILAVAAPGTAAPGTMSVVPVLGTLAVAAAAVVVVADYTPSATAEFEYFCCLFAHFCCLFAFLDNSRPLAFAGDHLGPVGVPVSDITGPQSSVPDLVRG